MGIFTRELNKQQRIKRGFPEENYKIIRTIYTGKDAYNRRVNYLKHKGIPQYADRIPKNSTLYVEYTTEAIPNYK